MEDTDSQQLGLPYEQIIIYPKKQALQPLPKEVPTEYIREFDEARAVRDLSAKCSAALSRRLIQRILHEIFNIKAPTLQHQIKKFITTVNPPAQLAEQLDAIQLVGNFAEHPIKDTSTGTITEVEVGEAEFLINILESVFDFAFVHPAKWASVKSALNAKLIAGGRPRLP
jgi:hypothetical protein